MLMSECKIGQRVLFGRPNGVKTVGVIVKLNPKKAKVKTLVPRGTQVVAGAEWGVPYSMLIAARDVAAPETVKQILDEEVNGSHADSKRRVAALFVRDGQGSPSQLARSLAEAASALAVRLEAAESADAEQRQVLVVYGRNEVNLDLAGKTVGFIRKTVTRTFDLAPDAWAVIDGHVVTDDRVLVAHERLEFIKPMPRFS